MIGVLSYHYNGEDVVAVVIKVTFVTKLKNSKSIRLVVIQLVTRP